MTVLVAAGVARAVGVLENAWTTAPQVLRRARDLELSGWTFHLAGRAGVLGDGVHLDALVAALGTVAPEAARAGWDAARRVGPGTVATARLTECACWGEDHLAEVADERVVELLRRVVDGADATAMPLFAATRRFVSASGAGCTGQAGAAVALLVHALAEYRGGAMLIGCRSAGLSPVEALIAEPQGEEEAIAMGWSPPFPARLTVLRRYAAAGALADRITGPAYETLAPTERVELVDRLKAAATTVAASV
jgi:hypothetical protein